MKKWSGMRIVTPFKPRTPCYLFGSQRSDSQQTLITYPPVRMEKWSGKRSRSI